MFLKLEPPEASFRKAMGDLDWAGMVILTGSIISLLYGITTGGHLHPWGSANIIIPISFATIGIAGFVLFEANISKNPIIPLSIFNNRTSVAGFISSGIHGLVWFGSAFFFNQYVRLPRLQNFPCQEARTNMVVHAIVLSFSRSQFTSISARLPARNNSTNLYRSSVRFYSLKDQEVSETYVGCMGPDVGWNSIAVDS